MTYTPCGIRVLVCYLCCAGQEPRSDVSASLGWRGLARVCICISVCVCVCTYVWARVDSYSVHKRFTHTNCAGSREVRGRVCVPGSWFVVAACCCCRCRFCSWYLSLFPVHSPALTASRTLYSLSSDDSDTPERLFHSFSKTHD